MKRKTVFSDCRGGHSGGLPFSAKRRRNQIGFRRLMELMRGFEPVALFPTGKPAGNLCILKAEIETRLFGIGYRLAGFKFHQGDYRITGPYFEGEKRISIILFKDLLG